MIPEGNPIAAASLGALVKAAAAAAEVIAAAVVAKKIEKTQSKTGKCPF